MTFHVHLDRYTYRRLIQLSHMVVFFVLGILSAWILFKLFPGTVTKTVISYFFIYLLVLAVLSGKMIGRVSLHIEDDKLVFRGLLPFQRFEVTFSQITKAWPGDSLSSTHNFIAMLRKKRNLENGKPNSNVIALDIKGKKNDPLEIKVCQVKTAHEIIAELESRGVSVKTAQFE